MPSTVHTATLPFSLPLPLLPMEIEAWILIPVSFIEQMKAICYPYSNSSSISVRDVCRNVDEMIKFRSEKNFFFLKTD